MQLSLRPFDARASTTWFRPAALRRRFASTPRPLGHSHHSGVKPFAAAAVACAVFILAVNSTKELSSFASAVTHCLLLLIGGVEPNPGPSQPHSLTSSAVTKIIRESNVGALFEVDLTATVNNKPPQHYTGRITLVEPMPTTGPNSGIAFLRFVYNGVADQESAIYLPSQDIQVFRLERVLPRTIGTVHRRDSPDAVNPSANGSLLPPCPDIKGSPSRSMRRIQDVLEPAPNTNPPPAPPPVSQAKDSGAANATPSAPEPILLEPVSLPALTPPAAPVAVELKPLESYQQAPTANTPAMIPPRATEKADRPPFRVQLPQVSFLQPRLCRNWAAAISTVIQDYKDKDSEARNKCVQVLLRCPEILLPQSAKRMGDRSIPHLSADEIATATPAPRRPTKSKTAEERTLNRAATLAIQGHLGRAVSALMRDNDVPEVSEEDKVELLRKLHPKRVEEVKKCVPENPVEFKLKTMPPQKSAQMTEPQLKAEVRRMCSGKAAGPSGWTEELIRDAITAENEKDWMALFDDIVNASLDSVSLSLLRRANLLGIPKKPSGIRPLAMGETLVKVAVKLLLECQKELFDRRAVGGFQYAFEKCGVEQIIHQVRELMRTDTAPTARVTAPADNDEDDTAQGTLKNHAVLVDCTNAFNTVRRQAISEALMSDAKFNPLRRLFNAFYVEQGELIIRSDAEEGCPVISSSEGVRQGDVLGPLFFCLALKPVIESTMMKFVSQHPDRSPPRFFAYMDDVTIVGEEKSCVDAFNILAKELESLSLMVNERKTVTTSPALATKLGVEPTDCFKLLGAFVGRAQEKEKEKIDEKPSEHTNLFHRLPLLPAEIGYRLLTKCGVPRWAHLIRTHEPEVVKPASRVFTEMSVRCLASILKVDYDHIDALTYRQIRLPIRLGGLGLHDWSERAEDAYEASLNNESKRDLQDDFNAPVEATTKEVAFWEDTMEVLKENNADFAAHLKRNASKMASLWLQGDITVASAQPSNAFRAAMLFRLRWAGAHPDSPTPFHCRCKFPSVRVRDTTTRDMVLHLAGCTKNGGPTKRHHFVRDALANIMTRAGYATQTEVVLDAKGELRMDIVATPPDGPTLYIDTTVANSTSRSLQGKDIDTALAKKDAEKKSKYLATAYANNAKYMTFGMDIFGHMSKESQAFLSELTTKVHLRCSDKAHTAATVASTTKHPLSKALAFGNGYCLLQSQQLHMLGVNLRAAPAALPAPVPVLDEPEECEFYCPPGDDQADESTKPENDETNDAPAASHQATTSPAPPQSHAPQQHAPVQHQAPPSYAPPQGPAPPQHAPPLHQTPPSYAPPQCPATSQASYSPPQVYTQSQAREQSQAYAPSQVPPPVASQSRLYMDHNNYPSLPVEQGKFIRNKNRTPAASANANPAAPSRFAAFVPTNFMGNYNARK